MLFPPNPGTITVMTDTHDPHDDLIPDTPVPEEDLRYAPPELEPEPESHPEPEAVDAFMPDVELPITPESFDAYPSTDVDIDSALAAVSTLSDMLAEQEAQERAEAEAEAARIAAAEARRSRPLMPMPPRSTLHRGQASSFVPALLLIGIGAWLTLMYTNDSPPDPALVAVIAIGAAALTLIVRWFTTGGWSRGLFFTGITVFALGAATALMFLPDGLGAGGWPLIPAALGLGVLLSGILTRPREPRLVFPGLLLIVGSMTALLLTQFI